MTQKEALHILKMGHSVFLTGAAGTGKTHLLNEYIDYLKSKNLNIAITASTGIAATHIGGQTIHSWSGIGIYDNLNDFNLDKILQNEKLFNKYKKIKVLIIDEISMLHGSKLNMINTLFKKFRDNNLAFGGIQVIFCGDFFQLPPVIKNKNDITNDFAFNSNSWQELNPIICYLEENYRQKNNSLVDLLNNIRLNKNKDEVLSLLNKFITKKSEEDILKLYTHNVNVDEINEKKYNSLSNKLKEYSFEMFQKGKKKYIDILKNNCLAKDIIKLKIDTKIIFIKNNKDKKYQNGTLGTVIDFDKNQNPIVKIFTGEKVVVLRESWQYLDENGKVLAEIFQFPIKYAWAITIHKSQGMTIDKAEIDLSNAFGTGMGYVALSRLKTLENINLIGINENALFIDENIIKIDKLFKEKSIKARYALSKYLDDKQIAKKELIKKQEDFILNSGGDMF